MESIGIVLKDIMGNSAVFIAGKEAVIVSAVSIVISVFIGILGLKLIRVWNAVIGFVAGALLGFAVTYLMGLEVVPVLIAAGVAGLVFAILNSVFKKFGAFWVCFLGMAGRFEADPCLECSDWICCRGIAWICRDISYGTGSCSGTDRSRCCGFGFCNTEQCI